MKSNYNLCHVCLSTRYNLAPTEQIFMKFYMWGLLEKSVKKLQVSLKLARIMGTLHEDLRTFMITPLWILLRMRNVSGKSCTDNQNTSILIPVPCIFHYFVLWPTNAQLSHKLSHSYMFRQYCVILRELVINALQSYTSISHAAPGKTVYN